MAGGDIIQLSANITGLTFTTAGDVLSSAHILPIFWGPYWAIEQPPLTRAQILSAMQSIVDGPYLDSLKEYGYVGPVTIERELLRFDTPPVLPTGPPGPVIDQVTGFTLGMEGLINNNIAQWNGAFDFPDKWLIVIAFLDPSIPLLVNQTGKTATGAHYSGPSQVSYAWVNCSGSQGFAQAMQTFSHELVETISDPVVGVGIIQTKPTLPVGTTPPEIADVCNQPALVNGVNVVAYWSQSTGSCVIPTATRRSVSLDFINKQTPKGGAWGLAPVNLGPICGHGIYDWTETTYHNVVTVKADVRGYEDPGVSWQINGAPVPFGIGSFNVPATWHDLPPGMPILRGGAGPPHNSSTTIRTVLLPGTYLTPGGNQLIIDAGPDAGDTAFTVSASAIESFDAGTGVPGQPPTSLRSAQLNVKLIGQQIIWDDEFQQAKKRCADLLGLKNDPVQGVGPPQPGDPPDLLGTLSKLLDRGVAASVQEVLNLANNVRTTRPELFTRLVSFAKTLAAIDNSFKHE
jgi:hypothetical protein